MSDPETVDIRRRSARLYRLVTGLTAALWVLLLLERFGALGLRAFQHAGDETIWRAMAAQLIAASPEVFYLLALGGVRRALGEFAQGRLYAPTLTSMLDRVGMLLGWGALIGVFAVPALQRLIGAGPGYWIAFDVSALVLGALGLSLTVIARVFRRAAALEAELAEIF